MRKYILLIPFFCLISTTVLAELAPPRVIGATTADTMMAKMVLDKGEIVFVDLRSAEDFNKGHIPGAKNLSMDQFSSETLSALAKKNQGVLFYCDGMTCLDSVTAVTQAMEWGWGSVYYFRNGYAYWTKVGLETEK